jgi:hypothetical protein
VSTIAATADPRDADEIAADVDRGLEVVAQIKRLQAELKEINARLTTDALQRPDEHEPLEDDKREGRRYFAVGRDYRLPLIVTADKLMGQFQLGSEAEKRVLAAIPSDKLPTFFKQVTVWENQFENGKKFRSEAVELLGADAPRFITACVARDKSGLPKSDIKIEWEAAAAHSKLKEAAES